MTLGVEASSKRKLTPTAIPTKTAEQGSSVMDQAIARTSDWYVSFQRMTWFIPETYNTVIKATSDWCVSFSGMPTWYESNLNDLPTLLAATSDWAVCFKSMTRTDDLGFDDTMLSLLPDLYLPMVETVPYSENFDTTMLSLLPDLFLPMVEQTQISGDLSFDDTVVALGAELFLPMVREDVQ